MSAGGKKFSEISSRKMISSYGMIICFATGVVSFEMLVHSRVLGRKGKFVFLTYILFIYVALMLNLKLYGDLKNCIMAAEYTRDAAMDIEEALQMDLLEREEELRTALDDAHSCRVRHGEVEPANESKDSEISLNSGSLPTFSPPDDSTSTTRSSSFSSSSSGEQGSRLNSLWKWLTGGDGGMSTISDTSPQECPYTLPGQVMKALERHYKYRKMLSILRWTPSDRARADRLRRELSVEFHPDKNRGCPQEFLTDAIARINSFR